MHIAQNRVLLLLSKEVHFALSKHILSFSSRPCCSPWEGCGCQDPNGQDPGGRQACGQKVRGQKVHDQKVHDQKFHGRRDRGRRRQSKLILILFEWFKILYFKELCVRIGIIFSYYMSYDILYS